MKLLPKNNLLGLLLILFPIIICVFWAGFPGSAQAQSGTLATPTPAPKATPIEVPQQVNVQPQARDEEIGTRLESILKATHWFINPLVRVQNGVVFLQGQTRTEEYKTWAGDLARNTQDVVAVVNQIEVLEPSIWDFQPALAGLRTLWRSTLRSLPFIGFSLLVLLIAWGIARLVTAGTRRYLHHRFTSALLTNVFARGAGLLVFIFGLYIVFHIAGLTNVALTVLGGTGLLGLVLGIAFRDITENFLASIFLSIQNPFHTGDLVEIVGIEGFVQLLNTRTTVLMTQDGNQVQIPNATVYKSTICNYSTNPNRRLSFSVGIGYDDAIQKAQDVALSVLAEHPVVLKKPEPWVLVDSLGSANVNLIVYFWFDGSRYSPYKVKSSVIRLVKRAFQTAGISMPDEAREVIFPQGVPVQWVTEDHPERPTVEPPAEESGAVTTHAEGGLSSEAGSLQEQARKARTLEDGGNLLKD